MIPDDVRKQLQDEPDVCARLSDECSGRITWEHALYYAGRKIQDRFAIIKLCEYHHLGSGLVKSINQQLAGARASEEDMKKYPRLNWTYLKK